MSPLFLFPSFSSTIILSIPPSAPSLYRHMEMHICRWRNSFWLPITTGEWSMSADVPIPRLPWWVTSVSLSLSLSGFPTLYVWERHSAFLHLFFTLLCPVRVCVCVFMHCIMPQLTINKLDKLAWICNSTVCLFHSYVKLCNHLHWPWKEYYCLWSYPRIIVCNA